jgi:hypothetical protein
VNEIERLRWEVAQAEAAFAARPIVRHHDALVVTRVALRSAEAEWALALNVARAKTNLYNMRFRLNNLDGGG